MRASAREDLKLAWSKNAAMFLGSAAILTAGCPARLDMYREPLLLNDKGC